MMKSINQAIAIPIGPRGSEGAIRLSEFSHDMLALSIEGRAERAPTYLLTLEQARELKRAIEMFVRAGENALRDEAA